MAYNILSDNNSFQAMNGLNYLVGTEQEKILENVYWRDNRNGA